MFSISCSFFLENFAKLYVSPGGSAPSPTGNPGSGPAKSHIYCPQRSWGKVIFSQASVILFTGGGVCLSACWNTTPNQAVPETRHPQDQAGTPLPLVAIFLFLQGWGLGRSGSATRLYCDNSTNSLY